MMPIKDKATRLEYQRQWIANRRASFFDGKSCVQCGANSSLELDHIDPAQKVSHRIWSWSKDRREAEIAKCQVLCTSCHVIKTATDTDPGHGTASKYRRGCRCQECRVAHRLRMRRYRSQKQNMEAAA